MINKKFFTGALLAVVFLGLGQSARAESLLQGFLNVFLRADNTQQAAQVDQSVLNSLRATGGTSETGNTVAASYNSNSNDDYSASPNSNDNMAVTAGGEAEMRAKAQAMFQSAQAEAQKALITAKKIKPTIGSKADLTKFLTGVKTGKSVANKAGASAVSNSLTSSGGLLQDFGDHVTIGAVGANAILSVLGASSNLTPPGGQPIYSGGIFGQGGTVQYNSGGGPGGSVGIYGGEGVFGMGGFPNGTGVIGVGNQQGSGVQGSSAGFAGVLGSHWWDSENTGNYGYGVYGSSTAGPGVAGSGWDRTDNQGNLYVNTGVSGYSQSGIGVNGYSEGTTGVVAGGKWTGLYAYANANSGTGVGIWSQDNGWGIYQYNQNSRNHLAGKVETEKDFCIVGNGPEKCLSQMSAGSGGSSNSSGGSNTLLRFDRGGAYSFYAGVPNQTDSVWQVQDNGHQSLLQINSDGKTKLTNLRGDGNAFLCVDGNGTLYRSMTACR